MRELITVKNVNIEKREHNKIEYYSATCISISLGMISATGKDAEQALKRLKLYVAELVDYRRQKTHRWPL